MRSGQTVGRQCIRLIFGLLLAATVTAAPPPAIPPAASTTPTSANPETPGDIARLNSEAKALLRSDPQRAQQLAQVALRRAQVARDRSGEAGARVNLGSIERQRGRYAQAVIEFERAVAIVKDGPDRASYANALANLGISLDLGGLHAESLEAQGEALKIYEALPDPARASAVLINLGNALSNLGDNARAREHYQRALEIKRKHGITKGIGAVLNNLADLALESGTTEQAVELLNQAIVAHQADDDRIGQGLALSNRGIANARTGRFDAALADIQQGEAVARELEHALGIAAALRARAEVWLLRARGLDGDAHAYAVLTAEREARAALVASSESDDPERRMRAQRLLADVLAERGDAIGALALIAEVEDEERTLRSQRDDARIAVVRARYQNQQQEGEMALLRAREATQSAKLARNRVFLRSAIGAAIAGLLAIILLFWIARERRVRADALRDQGEALRAALARAEQEGKRARDVAELNQRLLSIAGEDLQAPLAEIRSTAERLMAAHTDMPELSRPMAAIARSASDLIQIVGRMRESAHATPDVGSNTERVDLSAVLVSCVADAEPRARQRQQRLRAQIAPNLHVSGNADALLHALIELLDHSIRLNPADSNLDVVLNSEAGRAVLTLSDHDGAMSELLLDAQRAQSSPRDAPNRRLGLGLLRETILRAGGELDSIAAMAPETGQLLRVILAIVD